MNESPLLLAFVLTGAFFWSIGNVAKSYFLRKQKIHEDVVLVATMLGAAVFSFAAEGLIHGVPQVRKGFWIPFLINAVLNIGIQSGNIKALKLEDPSIVTSLSSSTPLFLIVMSQVILGEFPTPLAHAGIICISLGAYMIYLKGAQVELPAFAARVIPKQYHTSVIFWAGPWLRLWSSRGARLALGVAYLGAVALSFEKLVILNSSPMIYTGGAFMIVAAFTYIWSRQRGRWQSVEKTVFLQLFCLGLFIGLYTVLMNTGYYYGIAPAVGTLKRTQILWTVILAGIFLKEAHTPLRFVGAAIIFVGTTLIGLG